MAGPWPIDDAFITFRYAHNLARGAGLVYNVGERVLGTSTPLFTLLLAGVSRLTGATFPGIALSLSAVADASTSALLYCAARRLRLPVWAALTCSLSFAFYPLGIRYATGGMETSVAAFLVLISFTAFLSKRGGSATVLIALAVLTRADALAAAGVLFACLWRERRVFPWKAVLLFGLTVLPWLLFSLYEYGSPIPHSIQAKSRRVYLGSGSQNVLQACYTLAGLLWTTPELAAKGILTSAPIGINPYVFGGILGVALVLCTLGAMRNLHADSRSAPLFICPLLFAGTYALLGVRGHVMAEWYLVPLAPLMFVCIFSGLVELSDSVKRRFPTAGLAALTPAAGACLIVISQALGLDLWRSNRGLLVPRSVWTEREELYGEAAEFLKPRIAPEDVVAASEIGALGYYCECRILDTVGLVSPESVKYYPLPADMYAINYAVPPKLIQDHVPAYLVTLDVFIRRSLERSPWFRRDYELIWERPATAFGSRSLQIFARRRVR